MGILRKSLWLGTGGMSGLVVKANSKKERTAKALEAQLRMQKAEANRERQRQRAEALPGQRLQQQQAKVTRHEARIVKIETRGAAKVEKLQARTAMRLEKHRTKLESQKVELDKRQAVVTAKETVQAPPKTVVGLSTADELAKLVAMRDSGALSEEEFAAAKAAALGGRGPESTNEQ